MRSLKQGVSSVQYQNDFSQQGAQLAIIGNGGSHDLIKFRDVTGYPGILFTDPSLEVYKFLKFKSGLADVIGLKSFTQIFSALGTITLKYHAK